MFGKLFRALYGDAEAERRWIGPQFLGPLLIPYLMAAAGHSLNENQNPDPFADQVIVAAANAGRSMLDQIPLFSTYSMVASAAEVTNVDAAMKLFSRFVTPIMPAVTATAFVERLTDAYQRDPKTLDEIIKTKLPWVAQEVRTKVDVLGLPREGQPGDFGPRMLKERDDPIINESERLRVAQPDLWSGLQHVSKSMGDYELTYDQHHRYKELAGEERRKRLIALISDPKYQKMSSSEQAKLFRDVDGDARQAGRRRLGLEMAGAARTVDEVVQAADTAMVGSNYEKAKQVLALQQLGKLTPDVVARLDGRRTVTEANQKGYELSVADYMRGYQLVEAYKMAPQFATGTPDEWARAEAAAREYKPIYDAMRRDAEVKGIPVQQHPNFQNLVRMWSTEANGLLVRFYDRDGTPRDNLVSRERKAIKQDWLWDRFSSAVSSNP